MHTCARIRTRVSVQLFEYMQSLEDSEAGAFEGVISLGARGQEVGIVNPFPIPSSALSPWADLGVTVLERQP